MLSITLIEKRKNLISGKLIGQFAFTTVLSFSNLQTHPYIPTPALWFQQNNLPSSLLEMAYMY